MKYGIFGGTFDPPHLGHLEVARAALNHLELDEVIWIPNAKNPLKQHKKSSSGKDRLAMVQRAIAEEPQMSASDIEITRRGLSFTIDTVEELLMIMPGQVWVILGSDALAEIYDWKQPEKLAKLARFAAILRPPHDVPDALRNVPELFHDKIDWVPMPANPIRATDIRDRIERKLPIRDMVAPAVLNYIQEHRLYE